MYLIYWHHCLEVILTSEKLVLTEAPVCFVLSGVGVVELNLSVTSAGLLITVFQQEDVCMVPGSAEDYLTVCRKPPDVE